MCLLIPAVKQTLVPGAKGVQIVSQASLTAAQKNKLKEAGGGTFRFVTHSDEYHCLLNTGLQTVIYLSIQFLVFQFLYLESVVSKDMQTHFSLHF